MKKVGECASCTCECHNHNHDEEPSVGEKRVQLICAVAMVIFGTLVAPECMAIGFVVGSTYELCRKWLSSDSSGSLKWGLSCGPATAQFFCRRPVTKIEGVLAVAFTIFVHLRHGYEPETYSAFMGFWLGVSAVHEVHSRLWSRGREELAAS
jgi:hypothetical protein